MKERERERESWREGMEVWVGGGEKREREIW